MISCWYQECNGRIKIEKKKKSHTVQTVDIYTEAVEWMSW